MNFCRNCGNKLEVTDKFCTKCGQSMNDELFPSNNKGIFGFYDVIPYRTSWYGVSKTGLNFASAFLLIFACLFSVAPTVYVVLNKECNADFVILSIFLYFLSFLLGFMFYYNRNVLKWPIIVHWIVSIISILTLIICW